MLKRLGIRISILLAIWVMTEGLAMAGEQDVKKDMQIIAERLQAEWTRRTISQAQAENLLGTQQADGSWPGIDYGDRARTRWSPAGHTNRLSNLAEVYRTSKDAAVRDAVLKGLGFWVKKDPQSDNWWFNCINTPMSLGRVLLLMGDAVPQDLIDATAHIVRRSTFTRTGANLTWEAGNLMVLACALGDAALMRESIGYLTREIVITPKEGIQVDWSFHQHGPQLYMSNYGEVFSSDNSRYAVLFAGASFALGDEKIAALSGLIREGQQWFVWGGQLDYHALGRQIDSPGAYGRGRNFAGISERMMAVDAEHAEEYRNFAQRIAGIQKPGESGPKGNRHFWRSDVMVHRPGHFHVSVRMHATRTYATEVRVNRENLKGYHLSDGVYFTMQRGDEFRDIQPVWDWRKLPGMTYRDTPAPFPYGREVKPNGNTDFVGGVSDGQVGAAAMHLVKDDVQARKAWFFFERGFVCLGAGIQAEKEESVTTSVNQCLLRGEVLVLRNGKTSGLTERRLSSQEFQGIWHDGVGYLFAGPQKVVISAGPQTGAWTGIEERSNRKDPVTLQVFNTYINHGARPADGTYAYAVMPGVDQEALAGLGDDPGFDVLANEPEIQAVGFPGAGVVQVVFWTPGQVSIPNGPDVQVDAPCLVMVRKTGDGLALSVSEPTQTLSRIQVTLGGRFAGTGAAIQGDKTVVAVDLPREEWAGQTVQVGLKTR